MYKDYLLQKEKNKDIIFQILLFLFIFFCINVSIYFDFIHISFDFIKKMSYYLSFFSLFVFFIFLFLFLFFKDKEQEYKYSNQDWNNEKNNYFSGTQNKAGIYKNKRIFQERIFSSEEELYSYYYNREQPKRKKQRTKKESDYKQKNNQELLCALKTFNLSYQEFESMDLKKLSKIYKKLIKQYHPDILKNNNKNQFFYKDFEEKSKKINAAFNILKNIKKQNDII